MIDLPAQPHESTLLTYPPPAYCPVWPPTHPLSSSAVPGPTDWLEKKSCPLLNSSHHIHHQCKAKILHAPCHARKPCLAPSPWPSTSSIHLDKIHARRPRGSIQSFPRSPCLASSRLASSVAPSRALSLSPSSVTEMSNSRPRCPSTATTNGLPGNLFGFASKEFSYSRASSPLRCLIRAVVTRPHYPYHAHRTLYCSPYMLIAAPALQRQVPRRASTKHRLQYAIESRLPLLFYGSCAYQYY